MKTLVGAPATCAVALLLACEPSGSPPVVPVDAHMLDGGMSSTSSDASMDASRVEHCGASAPESILDCQRAQFWADCGGSGGPTLACMNGDCVWFSTGCVAPPYVATDCSASDVCCDASADGPWPYVDGREAFIANGIQGVIEDLAAIGGRVITRDAVDLAVSVDPSFQATPSRVECDTALQRDFCASTGFAAGSGNEGILTISMGPERGGGRIDAVYLDIVQTRSGTLGARVVNEVQDDNVYPHPRDCRLAVTVPMTVSGAVVISTLDWSSPEAVHGRADLVVDGHDARVFF